MRMTKGSSTHRTGACLNVDGDAVGAVEEGGEYARISACMKMWMAASPDGQDSVLTCPPTRHFTQLRPTSAKTAVQVHVPLLTSTSHNVSHELHGAIEEDYSMVHYARYLKPPKVSTSASKLEVKAVITITTDLGESFYPIDQELHVFLQDRDGEHISQTYTWTGGMRAMPVVIRIDRAKPSGRLISPVRLLVTSSPSPVPDRVDHDAMQPILSAWSAPFPLEANAAAARLVQRRLVYGEGPAYHLAFWEETGESIARHAW